MEEPDYLVDLLDDAVGVLQSREWFEWDNQSVPLKAGTTLFFRSRRSLKNIKHHSEIVLIGRHICPQTTETVC